MMQLSGGGGQGIEQFAPQPWLTTCGVTVTCSAANSTVTRLRSRTARAGPTPRRWSASAWRASTIWLVGWRSPSGAGQRA
jgi:hypothetical protein